MRFAFDQEVLTKEELDLVTEVVIKHCAEVHCTCDPVIELTSAGLIIEGGRLTELGEVSAVHTDQCYASGRRN